MIDLQIDQEIDFVIVIDQEIDFDIELLIVSSTTEKLLLLADLAFHNQHHLMRFSSAFDPKDIFHYSSSRSFQQ